MPFKIQICNLSLVQYWDVPVCGTWNIPTQLLWRWWSPIIPIMLLICAYFLLNAICIPIVKLTNICIMYHIHCNSCPCLNKCPSIVYLSYNHKIINHHSHIYSQSLHTEFNMIWNKLEAIQSHQFWVIPCHKFETNKVQIFCKSFLFDLKVPCPLFSTQRCASIWCVYVSCRLGWRWQQAPIIPVWSLRCLFPLEGHRYGQEPHQRQNILGEKV